MIKKLLIPVIGAVIIFSQAAVSNALDALEINLYGASAQYHFWNDAADNFLVDKMGCDANPAQYHDASGKHGVTLGENCTNASGGTRDITIRYSAKASYDGIRAMQGVDPENQCPDEGPYYRPMANVTDLVDGTDDTTECMDVTLGCSDVGGNAFTQSSAGQKLGHRGGGAVSYTFSGIDTSGLTAYNPLVVPFGFFLNNSVTIKRCLDPDPLEPDADAHKAMSNAGNICWDPDNDGHSTDCIGYYKCVDGKCNGGVNKGGDCSTAKECPDVDLNNTDCKPVSLDNISRLMAVTIFSGNAKYWDDFGAYFPNTPITACLRHAGSGTHATLDHAVMHESWGKGLITSEKNSGAPIAWFNKGSSDLMKCVDQNAGAIGYADADQLAGTKNYSNVHSSKYMGVDPRRETIRNGWYEFYSFQNLYEDPDEPNFNETHDVVVALMDYAKIPDNIPATKADFWATQGEMKWAKASDYDYPGKKSSFLVPYPQTP